MSTAAAANSESLVTSSSGKPVLTFVTGNPKKLEEVRDQYVIFGREVLILLSLILSTLAINCSGSPPCHFSLACNIDCCNID